MLMKIQVVIETKGNETSRRGHDDAREICPKAREDVRDRVLCPGVVRLDQGISRLDSEQEESRQYRRQGALTFRSILPCLLI